MLLSLANLTAGAQITKADSLAGVIDHRAANDTVKADLMVQLAKMLAYSGPWPGQ